MENIPNWILKLDDEDIVFLKQFVLASGSLKEIASVYGVTYPTVRLRLDRLIQKIKLNETESEDSYVSLIKKLSLNDEISYDATKTLINEFRKLKKGE